ncbi:MAG: hypothetical protein LBC03_07080 [Nitrososphaerota archaeon]|jgi:hypothetical protein|nr:hypothetical protein [Nitrososphaerota archaeon]
MKFRSYTCFAIFGLLLISLSAIQTIQAQQTTVYGEGFPHTADGDGFPMVSPISIDSPSNTTYTTNRISLYFTVNALFDNSRGSASMTYSLDGKDNVTIPTSINFVPIEATITDANGKQTTGTSQFFSYYTISGSVDLKNLQSGQHSLTVFGRYTVYSMSDKVGLDSQTIYFTVDDESLPVTSTISVDESVPKFEQSINMFYVFVGVFSLIAAVVACTLFIKHRTNSKNVTSINTINV